MVSTAKVNFSTRQEQSGPAARLWFSLAGAVVFLLLLAATRWILDHPFGIHWDEALYFNEALADLHKLHSGSLRQWAAILIGGDPFRPPAYRLVALPFLAVFGFHTALARFVTLALWVTTVCFIYLTSRRLSSRVAGVIAVLVFCLAPEVFSDSVFFSTEGPLLLATSAMLYFLWGYEGDALNHKQWIGLGMAIGIGLLSKATFILIALPVLSFALFADHDKFTLHRMKPFFKAGILASVVAAPWWIKNVGPALRYGKFATDQSRESLGAPSLLTFVKWLGTIAMGLLGPAVTILIAFLVVVCLVKVFNREAILADPARRSAVLACASAGLLLAVVQLSGIYHNLRYMTPAVGPLAIVVGIVADVTGHFRSKAGFAAFTALVLAQLMMIVAPVAFPNNKPADPGLVNGGLPWGIMVRFEQWDWKPLQNVAKNCDLQQPRIAFLGDGRPLNPPQILYPWFATGSFSSDAWLWRSEPLWLWRYSEGPIDWGKVMNSAGQSDIVVTAPDFTGQVSDKQDQDNRYNREFAARLSADPRFQGPFRLEMGRFQPVEVDVFVKKSAPCHDFRQERAAR